MKGLLQAEGKTSSVRVAMLACVITGCAIAVIGVVRDRNLIDLAVLVTGLVGAGFAGKVTQKGKEQSNG